jgi:CHAD domain-containing protein
MRVASRRLRSTLPLFASCFSRKAYRRFAKEFRAITVALGAARDTDVQIAFLNSVVPGASPAEGQAEGIQRIRTILAQRRHTEQETILAALDAMEEKNVLEDLQEALRGIRKGRPRKGGNVAYTAGVRRLAAARIRKTYATFLSYDPVVHDPGDVKGHHAMRIAAKKLRYTLEVFRPLYPDRLRPAIRSMKHIQELLGQIHDCDVWISLLSGKGPAGTSRNTPVHPGAGSLVIAPGEDDLAALYADRRTTRKELHRQLVAEWETAILPVLGDRLRAALEPDGRGDRLPAPATGTGDAGAAGPAPPLVGRFPEGAGHSRQVTRLSLRLFDSLVSLHGYGKKERNLLAYAGLLHDIGWAFGQKGHHTRSCRMILSDTTLPVTPQERTMIALIARNHRKPLKEGKDRLFSGLTAKDRRRVLALSALLRIADGLDYTHADRVLSLSCTVSPSSVTCIPEWDGEPGVERERALTKSDLFERVFARRFEIP